MLKDKMENKMAKDNEINFIAKKDFKLQIATENGSYSTFNIIKGEDLKARLSSQPKYLTDNLITEGVI
jgi:hypothetical protein